MPDDIYQWVLGNTITHCPTCFRLAGQRLPATVWLTMHLPGFHSGCRCRLVLVNALTQPYLDTYGAVQLGEWLGELLTKVFLNIVMPLLPTVPVFTLDHRNDSAAAKRRFQTRYKRKKNDGAPPSVNQSQRPGRGFPAGPNVTHPPRVHRGEDEEEYNVW